MSNKIPVDQPNRKPSIASGLLKWLRQWVIITLMLAAILIITSGHLDWVMAWVYIGLYIVSVVSQWLVLSPELKAERAQIKEDTKSWDRVLAPLMALYCPACIWITAGLDIRFGWSPFIPLTLQIVALVIAVLGFLLTMWAMASNRFFYGTVCIQKDRGHTVVTSGPYQYMRHPGYVGAIIFNIATPLILNSLWAFIPAAFTTGIIIVRTALEDMTLKEELDGYRGYAKRVRYRLLPGIW